MNDEHMHEHGEWHHHKGVLKSPLIATLAAAFLVVATVFVGALAIHAIKNFDSFDQPPTNVITVDGEGKVSAVPNVASISFSVSEDADTAAKAQDAATKKTNTALALLKSLGITDKDMKTSSYTISPRYSYPQPCYGTGPCVYNETQKIIGYTVSETVEVKVRNVDDTGKVLATLGSAGISNVYGPNFTIDNEDDLKAQARKDAIAKARAKAEVLVRDLGVRLVRVVNFSENGAGYPIPYLKSADAGMGSVSPSTPPQVPTGTNDITVDVSITYEIR